MTKKFAQPIFATICMLCLISFFATPALAIENKLDAGDISDTESALDSLRPILNVPLKTIPQFSKATFETADGEIKSVTVPWIAEYIIGVYQYALIIGAILAILTIIVGGFLYMLSGAKPELATKSKQMIFGSLSGLILLLGSYLVLNLINPEMTNLKSITLESVKSEGIVLFGKDEALNDDGYCAKKGNTVLEHCGMQTNSTQFSPEAFDQMFKDFAACGNFNWKILKGIAYYESGFKPYSVNCACYKGLFQNKNGTLEDALGKGNMSYYFSAFGMDKTPLTTTDPRIFDTRIQTAAMTKRILKAKKQIETTCGAEKVAAFSDSDMATLLYAYHNSGSGTLSRALKKGGCNGGPAIETGMAFAWQEIIIERCKKNAFDKGKTVCTEADGGYQGSTWTGGDYKNLGEAAVGGLLFGQGKAASVRKAGENVIIKKYKTENLFQAEAGGSCPLTLK